MSYQEGLTALRQGNFRGAELALRQALVGQPSDVAILATLSVAVLQQGRAAEAEEIAHQSIEMEPTNGRHWANLGACQYEQRNWPEAVKSFEKAVKLESGIGTIWSNLGAALLNDNRLVEAEAAHQRAFALDPRQPNVLINYGGFLSQWGRPREALKIFQDVLANHSQAAQAWAGAGGALRMLGRIDESIAALRQAQQLAPKQLEVEYGLGMALLEREELPEAEQLASELIVSHSNSAEAWVLSSAILAKQGNYDEALVAGRRSLDIGSNHADALNNMGAVLSQTGELDRAIECYRQALAQRPDFAQGWSNYLYLLQFSPSYTAADIFAEHRRWNERFAAPLARFHKPHLNDPRPERRLRLGYVAPTFRNHCSSLFTLPLFTAHHRSQFEVVCYSDVLKPDEMTQRLRFLADGWRNIAGRADEEVAEIIRQDKIDILIDLNLHMDQSRALLFARKPAPVQVCWLGYPGTTGLTAMDYRLTDPFLEPSGEGDHFYAEESIRLPDTFWCYDPLHNEPFVGELPARERGSITFANFNNLLKVNADVIELWSRILQRVESSRLLLLSRETTYCHKIREQFEARGVSGQRIEFRTPRPRPEYLQLYHEADIGLDAIPVNGHTTSLDSYWMGVPVVTLVGKTLVGRAGLSQLTNLGLTELVAHTPEQFCEIAAELAADLPRLGELRAGLRERLERSPLMDAPRFARNMEAALRQMWRRWCGEVGG